jgi:hypothetical protein
MVGARCGSPARISSKAIADDDITSRAGWICRTRIEPAPLRQ